MAELKSRPTTSFLPALRFRALTRVYDPVVQATTRESMFKSRLLDQAALEPGHRVLDLGCGTGTLALLAKQRAPDVDLVGLDADPDVLVQARSKADDAGAAVSFDLGLSTQLPHEDASFDRVLSSLFFHHLTPPEKRRTLTEIRRVLRGTGELHVADWGRPQDPAMRVGALGIRVLDGFERTGQNLAGQLPHLIAEAGLTPVAERDRFRTLFGTLTLLSAGPTG